MGKSHKTVSIIPSFLKSKESRSGSNRGPSAYQPSALQLGQTGLRDRIRGWAVNSSLSGKKGEVGVGGCCGGKCRHLGEGAALGRGRCFRLWSGPPSRTQHDGCPRQVTGSHFAQGSNIDCYVKIHLSLPLLNCTVYRLSLGIGDSKAV